MNLDDLPDPMTDRDLAKKLGKSPATVREMCKRGEWTYYLIGSTYTFDKADILRDVEEKKCQRKAVEPTSNGVRTKRRGTYTNTPTAGRDAEARARMTLQKQRDSLRSTSSRTAAQTIYSPQVKGK